MERDLNKAFCAFRPHSRNEQRDAVPIATGNWGCGAFNGDPELKFLLQWMAASQSGQRPLRYFTAGNKGQGNRILGLVDFLGGKGVNVGTLYKAIEAYYVNQIDTGKIREKTLFEYIIKDHKW